MKRTYVILASMLTAAASGSAVASAHTGAPSVHASSAAKVQLRHTRIGAILTTASGLTLYEFTRDHSRQDSCVTIHGCAAAWPALESSGQPSAGPGVKGSLLSTIRLPDGVRQVTYAGHPLYTYVADTPGSTAYVGVQAFGGSWDAVSAVGAAVK